MTIVVEFLACYRPPSGRGAQIPAKSSVQIVNLQRGGLSLDRLQAMGGLGAREKSVFERGAVRRLYCRSLSQQEAPIVKLCVQSWVVLWVCWALFL